MVYNQQMVKDNQSKTNVSNDMTSKIDQIKELAEMKNNGILSAEEFEKEKQKILGSS